MGEPRLVTASWAVLFAASKIGPLDVQPVRISRSGPRFWAGAKFPVINELIPAKGQDRDSYLAQLDQVGIPRLQARFAVIAAESRHLDTLALVCFEADRNDCHRSWFAERWEQRTGVAVPELLL